MLEGHGKVAIIGVGSELNGDDRAGIIAAELLKGTRGADVYIAGNAPESFTHLSKKGYSHIIIIDAVKSGGKPGEIRYFEGGRIAGNEISTHKLPLKLFIGYLQKSCNAKVTIAGIEPKNIGFGEEMSSEVEAAAERLAGDIRKGVRRGWEEK